MSTKHERRKTRRSGKKKIKLKITYESGYSQAMKPSRTFYDSAGDLIEIKSKKNGMYDSIKERFLTTDLSIEELEVIKKQSLDMSLKKDKELYLTLSDLLK